MFIPDKEDKQSNSRSKRSMKKTGISSENITNPEVAGKQCNEWKNQYDVVAGISWGSLPYELQTRWLKIGCDKYLTQP